MKERLLIFDFDGVIADSLVPFRAAVTAAWSESGMTSPMTDEQFLRIFDTNMYEGLEILGLPMAKVGLFMAALGKRVAQCADCRFFEGIQPVVRSLMKSNHIVVVTSNLSSTVRGMIELHGIQGVEDVLGADKGTSKVEKIRMVLHRFPGVSAWYVGDTCGDIKEGKAAGVMTVAAGWGWHCEARLKAARPDILLRKPADLVAHFGA